MDWKAEVAAWPRLKRQPECLPVVLKVFETAFARLTPDAFVNAWFGVHRQCISLTLGRLWLCALYKTDFFVLVDTAWQAPVRIRNAPFGWRIYDWQEPVLFSNLLWESYTKACQEMLATPAAAAPSVIVTQNKTLLPFLEKP